jgi:hypothetical protein
MIHCLKLRLPKGQEKYLERIVTNRRLKCDADCDLRKTGKAIATAIGILKRDLAF